MKWTTKDIKSTPTILIICSNPWAQIKENMTRKKNNNNKQTKLKKINAKKQKSTVKIVAEAKLSIKNIEVDLSRNINVKNRDRKNQEE